ncbi:MAG: FliI/YscN family ATPase [Oligoflexia bacterium]|nr:FliI/YscN family ATPase [Oligoflexia bacterium]
MQAANLSLPNFVAPSLDCRGKVTALRGPTIAATLPFGSIGDQCLVHREDGTTLLADIIAFNDRSFILSPLDEISGVGVGAEVRRLNATPHIILPTPATGLVLDAIGKTLIDRPASHALGTRVPIKAVPPNVMLRHPITEQLITGIKLIDTFCPIGYGQRLVVSAQAGLGKSTLLGMMTRTAAVDVVVIALVGERGREVGEFLHETLGEDGLKRAVVVVATSDESPSRRLRAPFTATAIAEHFRAQGKRVLLLVDSLTRTARAIREIGIAAGELPIRQGYTASVYSELPRLLERAGNDDKGSITALYTMLATSEREPDTLTDEMKSLVDGHLVLTHEMADWGVRPAIDPIKSLSRLEYRLLSAERRRISTVTRRLIRRIQRDRDILLLGGTPDKELQLALELEPALRSAMTQELNQSANLEKAWNELEAISKLASSGSVDVMSGTS